MKYIVAEYFESDCRIGLSLENDFRPDTVVHITGCGVDDSAVWSIDAPQKIIIVPHGQSISVGVNDNHSSKVSILYPSLIVGTGMDGFLRKVVNGIARGTYFHVRGNEARFSVVHALDVARLVRLVAPIGGEYRFSDGINPTLYDIAEALSVRVNHKRITVLSPVWASRLARIAWITGGPDKAMLEIMTRDDIVENSEEMASLEGFSPRNTVVYLSTHKYDENDI